MSTDPSGEITHYEISTVSLPAYIVLYRNPRCSNRWFLHRGYAFEKDATATAQSFKNVGFDVIIVPLRYDETEMRTLNAF